MIIIIIINVKFLSKILSLKYIFKNFIFKKIEIMNKYEYRQKIV